MSIKIKSNGRNQQFPCDFMWEFFYKELEADEYDNDYEHIEAVTEQNAKEFLAVFKALLSAKGKTLTEERAEVILAVYRVF